jgi:glutamate dehydrogenase
VGEGGNLGCTQLGRVEYDLAGGLINTDAIDNSAGVDCSDHEVNIKILLGGAVADGELTLEARNELLASMTDEVAELVLDNNRAQTLALMIARRQALPMVNVHARYLDQLEAERWLDRQLEFLPTDKQLAERQATGSGLRSPEFAVVLAYTKNADVADLLRTDVPDDEHFVDDLVGYFPSPLREPYRDRILQHRLRREIVATVLVNQMVNLAGISFDHRMTEDTGASVGEIVRAWVAVRDVIGLAEVWAEIDGLDRSVPLQTQLDLLLDIRRAAERCVLWLLRHRRPPIDTSAAVAEFAEPIGWLADHLHDSVRGAMAAAVDSAEITLVAAGVPPVLARRAGVWRILHTGFDIAEVARHERAGLPATAGAYWEVFDRLDLLWLWEAIGALPRNDRWQTQARSALRDDLLGALAGLCTTVLRESAGSVPVWLERNARAVERSQALFTELRRAERLDLTTLSVALRQLRNLGGVRTAVPGAS